MTATSREADLVAAWFLSGGKCSILILASCFFAPYSDVFGLGVDSHWEHLFSTKKKANDHCT